MLYRLPRLSQCVIEAWWFYNLFSELKLSDITKKLVALLFEDNQSAKRINKSSEQPRKLKYININIILYRKKLERVLLKLYVYLLLIQLLIFSQSLWEKFNAKLICLLF